MNDFSGYGYGVIQYMPVVKVLASLGSKFKLPLNSVTMEGMIAVMIVKWSL